MTVTIDLDVLLANYAISVQMDNTPSLWCLRKKPLFSGQTSCWAKTFPDFYDDPQELTLARILHAAAEHEAAEHGTPGIEKEPV